MDDAEIIEQVARRVGMLAQDMRLEAPRVANLATVQWSGAAAVKYRGLVQERADDYRRLSGDLDRLHGTLRSHARHVRDHQRFVDWLDPLSLLTGGSATR